MEELYKNDIFLYLIDSENYGIFNNIEINIDIKSNYNQQ